MGLCKLVLVRMELETKSMQPLENLRQVANMLFSNSEKTISVDTAE